MEQFLTMSSFLSHFPHIHSHAIFSSEDKPQTNIPRAILTMVCAGLVIGISSAMIRAYGEGLPEFETAFFRGIVGFVILLTLMGTGVKKIPVGNRRWLLFWRGLFGSLASMLYVWAIYHLQLGLANGLNQTSPIFVCLCAAIFLKERFGWWIYLTVCIAVFGMMLIVSPDFSSINVAALVAVLSAVLSAFAYTCIKKLQATEESDTIVLWFLGMSALVPIFTIPFVPWQLPTLPNFFGLLGAGVTCLIGQQLMTRAYRYGPATIVAPFIYTSTISSLFISFFIWDELPSIQSLVGCAVIIIAAIAIGVLPKNHEHRLERKQK
ncbi:MAG: DMT family transporter [Proteobacteria bacterium]|nr:DMT family transporter [Pseudomonadota bacterium]